MSAQFGGRWVCLSSYMLLFLFYNAFASFLQAVFALVQEAGVQG